MASLDYSTTAHSSNGLDNGNGQDVIQTPSIWTVMQDWIDALPAGTPTQEKNRLILQKELQWILDEFDGKETIGENGLVFSHNDLIPGNIIIQSDDEDLIATDSSKPVKVTFIDHECAMSCPAAFEIASHFACWIGNECDYTKIPSKYTRRQFLVAYTKSYCQHRGLSPSAEAELLERLSEDVDRYRGIPGFYWALWGFVHSETSELDFDSAAYGKQRLEEYYAWKREYDGSRANTGEEMPFREQRWAREE
ncbi:uncharacterized protein N7477_010003 [Penicillium maclennaniae]|uniref:uncharacterized protein n=1 Tax=Penicillium maclennaniae TaxID=1343394 RepID=UPI0025424342|nr:uncharacterized protein N7477_010003 [Penicillium maclennaniae]KAJ5662387.1 hypothetical protein N7477_010003 [Penicillium maclennaniae]